MKKRIYYLLGIIASIMLLTPACVSKDEKLAKEAEEKNARCPFDDDLGGILLGVDYDASKHNLTLLYECGAKAEVIDSEKPDGSEAYAILEALNQDSPLQLLIGMASMADVSITLAWQPAGDGAPITTTVEAGEVKNLNKAGYVSNDARGRLTLAALVMRANGEIQTQNGIGFDAKRVEYDNGKLEIELNSAPEWDAKGQLWKQMKEAVVSNVLTRQMLELAANLGCSVEFELPEVADDIVFEASGLVLLFR